MNRHWNTDWHKRYTVGLRLARTPVAAGQAALDDRPGVRPAPMDLGMCPGPAGANRMAASAPPAQAIGYRCCSLRLLGLWGAWFLTGYLSVMITRMHAVRDCGSCADGGVVYSPAKLCGLVS